VSYRLIYGKRTHGQSGQVEEYFGHVARGSAGQLALM